MPSFGVLKGEKCHFFTLFPAISVFSRFQKFPDLGRSKIILGSFFAFLSKMTQKYVSHRPNQKFSVDLSLTSWPWVTLTFNMLTECLRWYLEVSQIRSMSLHWLISISYGSSARQIQILQIVKHFDFDLTCDVISDPGVNNIRFPSTNSPDLSRSFEFCKSDKYFLSYEGGGQK